MPTPYWRGRASTRTSPRNAVTQPPPTRAAVLLGLAAVSLSGCALVRDRVRVLAKGCVDVPSSAAVGIVTIAGTLRSRHVGQAVGYVAALAGDVDRRTIDRAIYVLPGRSATARSVFATLSYDGALSAVTRSLPILRRSVLVAVDAGETYFHPRASGEDRLALVTEELPNVVARLTGARPRHEALMGMSMGGYGALLAAEREPGRYAAVAVAGPAIFPSYENERGSVGDAFDSAADFARYDVIAHAAALRGRPVRIRCGVNDPFVPGVRAFAQACPSADVLIEKGCHDDGFWRTSAPALLEFVAAHL
jgi:pimeloyl-ACP methyl ester carboxylesterase